MTRTIHSRPMVMIILILGLTLMTWSTPGNATPQQQRRPQYQCRTCPNAPSQHSPGKNVYKDPLTDLTTLPETSVMPTDDPPESSSSTAQEPDVAAEEPTPAAPVKPLEALGAGAILLFLVVQGLRWSRGRG